MEKDDDYLRGQPQEGGRLGQRLRGGPGQSLHLQSDTRLAVYKIRLADSFLSTDRGRYLYWVDAALGGEFFLYGFALKNAILPGSISK